MNGAPDTDQAFAGAIPRIYDQYLVPLIFEPYAVDLAARLAQLPLTTVLELAAGTGAVTRRLALALPATVAITATDLNQPMLDQAAATGTSRPVSWRQADALELPFRDASFDAVVCQFGVMFFPDKARGFAEARRVLKPGGVFIFNVWDRIEVNDFALCATDALAELFLDDPPRFMARVPHGYHEGEQIKRDLTAGGFRLPAAIETVTACSRAASAHIVSVAYCQGTPLRNEIEARAPAQRDAVTARVESALIGKFGNAAIEGQIRALVVMVFKDAESGRLPLV